MGHVYYGKRSSRRRSKGRKDISNVDDLSDNMFKLSLGSITGTTMKVMAEPLLNLPNDNSATRPYVYIIDDVYPVCDDSRENLKYMLKPQVQTYVEEILGSHVQPEITDDTTILVAPDHWQRLISSKYQHLVRQLRVLPFSVIYHHEKDLKAYKKLIPPTDWQQRLIEQELIEELYKKKMLLALPGQSGGRISISHGQILSEGTIKPDKLPEGTEGFSFDSFARNKRRKSSKKKTTSRRRRKSSASSRKKSSNNKRGNVQGHFRKRSSKGKKQSARSSLVQWRQMMTRLASLKKKSSRPKGKNK